MTGLDDIASKLFLSKDSGGGLFENPLFNFGMGLLANSGPTQLPVSFGQRLAAANDYAQQRGEAGLRNEMKRMELKSAKDQQALIDQLGSGDFPGLPPEMVPWLKAFPKATLPAVMASLFPDPSTQLQNKLTTLQIDQLSRALAAEAGSNTATTESAIGNINSIVDAAERLDENKSLFAPGGLVEQLGGLEAAAAGLSAMNASGFGTTFTDQAMRNVNDALTVQKATAALVTNLQQAAPTGSRSATAIQQLDKALGAGMPWPAKRRVVAQRLGEIISDVKARGAESEVANWDEVQALHERLIADDKRYTKGQPTTPPPLDVNKGIPDNAVKPAPNQSSVKQTKDTSRVLPKEERDRLVNELKDIANTPSFASEQAVYDAISSGLLQVPPEGVVIMLNGQRMRVEPQ